MRSVGVVKIPVDSFIFDTQGRGDLLAGLGMDGFGEHGMGYEESTAPMKNEYLQAKSTK